MSMTREQMITMLEGELARRKRMKALPQSMENIKKDQEGYTAGADSFGENLAAGFPAGIRRGALGAVNLLTSNPRFARGVPDFASNERLREIDKQDKDLRATGGGMVGGLAGEVVSTGPIGGLTGKAMTKAPSVLQRTIGSLPVRSAAEGAVTSAVVADPEKRGEAAWEGAAAGGAFGVAGVAGKRLLKGAVEKSQAAADLITHGITEGKKLFIPLGQATQRGADEPKAGAFTRTLGAAYRGLLPYFPGAGEQIEKQAARLEGDIGEMAVRSVDKALDPAGVGTLPDDVVRDPQRAVKELGDKIRASYKNTVKSYSFAVPSDMEQQVRARIRQSRPDVPQAILDDYTEEFMSNLNKYTDNGVITGNNLMDAKNLFGKKPRDLAPTVNDQAMVDDLHNMFDELVETQLQYGNVPSNLADLAEYKRTKDAWHKFAPLERTVNSKKAQRASGHFKPADLIDNAGSNVDQRQLGQTAHAVTGNRPISVSAEGRTAGRGLGLLGTGAAWGSAGLPGLAIAGSVMGGANVAATETAQKLLMGDTKTQQFIIQMLRKDPELAQQVGSILRAGGTTAVGDSNKVTE